MVLNRGLGVQKGNKPKIEDIIFCCLDDDLQKVALVFAAYMRESKLPFKICTSTTRVQEASCKGKAVCRIGVYGDVWKILFHPNLFLPHNSNSGSCCGTFCNPKSLYYYLPY